MFVIVIMNLENTLVLLDSNGSRYNTHNLMVHGLASVTGSPALIL